jgi:predicted TIM-barrel fold metal-dependent hydrolase
LPRSRTRTRPSSSDTTPTNSDLQSDWDDLPAVDHHCHPLLRLETPLSAVDLRRPFTEAVDEGILREHTQHSVAYLRALRILAGELRCEPTEDAVLRNRDGRDLADHANRLLKNSRTGVMILDHGFAGGAAMSRSEHAAVIDIPQHHVVRLETAAEGLVATCNTVTDWVDAVRSLLRDAVGGGAVGVKTIAAYRAGLRLGEPDQSRAAADYETLRARAGGGQVVRLEGEPLCHTLLLAAAEECSGLGVPMQVHSGLGDPDEDLALANPLGLRRLFVEPRFADLKLVLLHCYPFHREAAYLSAVFPGVYMDLSLAIHLAAQDGARALEETLGLCPTSKLLYATDASRFPEVYFVAAVLYREALARALGRLVDLDWLTRAEAVEAGRQVLSGNARRIYPLPSRR